MSCSCVSSLVYVLLLLFFLLPTIACDPSPLLKRKTHTNEEYAPRERTRPGVETVIVDATGASQPVVGATFSIHDLNLGFPSDALVTVKRTSDLDETPNTRTTNDTTSEEPQIIGTDIQTETDTEIDTETETETETETDTTPTKEEEHTTENQAHDAAPVSIELPVENEPPRIDYSLDAEAERLAQMEEEMIYAQLEMERQQRAERNRLIYEMEQETKARQEEEMRILTEKQRQERMHREQMESEQREQEKQRQLELQHQQQQQQEQQRQQQEQQRQQEEKQMQQQQRQQQQQQQQHQHQQEQPSSSDHALVIPGTSHEIIHANPSETLFTAFQTSTLFQEVTYYNAWNLIQLGKPFAIFVLCRCDKDDDWNIPRIEQLIREKGLADHFTYLYALPQIQHQFHMFQTYSIESPALVIDNMPIGQHIEKYVFPKRLARPAEASPHDIVNWLEDFFQDPTPLPLLIRSRPAPPSHASTDRGMVWELVGDTITDIVMNSPFTVLLLLYSPSCPACHQIFPVFDRVAQQLSFTDPNVIIAKLDRTVNDVPFILRFHKYPTILLFRADHKTMDITHHHNQEHLTLREKASQRGLYGSHGWAKPLDFDEDYRAKQAPSSQPHDPNSCGRPYDEHELIAFVREHASKPQIASTSFSETSAPNA